MLWWLIFAIVILLAVQMTLQLICTRIDTKKFPPSGKMVSIPGAQMHVCVLGHGAPPVVLESGIAASSINWSPLQTELATFTTAYSYDRAGFGWSVSTNRNCTLARMADDLHAMLAAMRVPAPYVLVGHSFAGYITRAYANRYPEELAGLVLVDPLTPEEWIDPTPAQRWNLRGGIWFSRAGGVLASLGVVRFCLWMRSTDIVNAWGQLNPKGACQRFNRATPTQRGLPRSSPSRLLLPTPADQGGSSAGSCRQ